MSKGFCVKANPPKKARKKSVKQRPLNLPWEEYPAGAHVILLHGGLHICVTKRRTPLYTFVWDSHFTLSMHGGGGALFPVEGAKTRELAIIQTEEWLKNHLAEILGITV